MGFVEGFLLPVLTSIVILSFFLWLIFIVHWGIKRAGVYKRIKFNKLKKKFGNDFEFNENMVELVDEYMNNGWKYYTVKKLAKTLPEGDELLYTYLWLEKLNKIQK